MKERKQYINYTVSLQFTENSILKIVTLTAFAFHLYRSSVQEKKNTTIAFNSRLTVSTKHSWGDQKRKHNLWRTEEVWGNKQQICVKALWLQRPQKTAVLGATKWWGLGFSVSHSRIACCDFSSLIQLHHQPRMLLGDRGHSHVWLLSRATTLSFCHITAPTHTFVIIHGYLCIVGGTGAAVLCTCNSTSSQSPQEGSGQEKVCQQAGQIGHMEANRALLIQSSLLLAFAFFCQSYWIHLLIWSSAWGFIKISKGMTLKGEKLKFGIF